MIETLDALPDVIGYIVGGLMGISIMAVLFYLAEKYNIGG